MSNNEIEEIRQMVKKYEDSLPQLRILIFGPSQRNTNEYARKCFHKRINIKKSLSNKNCVAIFPEEAFNEAKKQGRNIQNITNFEKYLIEHHCDLAIFLYVPKCPGVDHELSVLSILPECVRKTLLFYAHDSEYNSRWSVNDKIDFIKGGGGRIEPFCQDDIDQCHIRKKVIQEIERVRRFLSMYPYKKHEGVE